MQFASPAVKPTATAEPGDLIAITGSDGWVEIAVNGGSAQSVLKLECGAIVQLLFETNN
jgi:S-adenosylmethionine hydrolase